MYWRPYDMKIIITVALSALAATSTAAAIPDPNAVSGYDASAITDAARPTQSVAPDDRAVSRAAVNPSVEIPYLGVDDRAVSRAAEAQASTANPLTQLRRADARQAREDARKAAAKAATAIYGGSNNQRAPDFWNYDPTTGEKIADTSPGLSSDELAKLSGVPTVIIESGGYRWLHAGEGAAVGFGFALILAAMTLLIMRSRRVVPA